MLGCVVVATPTSRERERAETQHSHHCTIKQHPIARFPPSVFAYRQAGPPVSTGGFLDVGAAGMAFLRDKMPRPAWKPGLGGRWEPWLLISRP